MREAIIRPSNNTGQILRLQIKQKNVNIKKRKVKTWSPEEDDQLVKLYQQYPKKWGIIASFMQDRNQNQCLHRYRRLSQLGAHKKIWSAKEDHTILSLIKKVGKNWKLLAEILGTKTGKQIRERFINKLDPKIKTDDWSDEEDKLILKYYSQLGSRWSEISKKLSGRPENQIKNRFYSYIQKNYDIRYVLVQNNEQNQHQGNVHFNLQRKIHQPQNQFNQILETAQQVIIINPYSQTPRIENEMFKQICLNERKQINKTLKHKDRQKHLLSRFNERKNQQNIYEDDEQYGQKVKKKQESQILHPQQKIPSIKQFVDEFKIPEENVIPQSKIEVQYMQGSLCMAEERDEILESNVLIGQKYYIKSLIKVEDEIVVGENRDKSVRDLVSHNEIESHENDLFYLLNI